MKIINLIILLPLIITIIDYYNNLNYQHPITDIMELYQNNNSYFKSIHVYSNVKEVYFYKNTSSKNDMIYKINYEKYEQFMKDIKPMKQNNIPIYYSNQLNIFNTIINVLINFIIIFFAIKLLYNFKQSEIFTLFFKNKTNDIEIPNITFNDVIGLESIKKELNEYTNFMKYRDTYIKSGYTIPTGLLFVGPPGTGKTYLAKAFAKESGAKFIPVCGSDFIEIFVGMGSKRIRELFKTAREEPNKPCVIFIDEIDAIGGKRIYNTQGASSEHNSTLNSLLVEMDGFTSSDNILIIGSTNMVEALDPALTRSGRFDKQIIFDPPNIDERKQLFKLYLNKAKLNKSLKDNLDNVIEKLSKLTAGLTGADIKNIVNQSIYNFLSITPNKELIKEDDGVTYDDLHKSIDQVMIGMEKPERKMSKEEINRVAYHEAGHTLISYLLSTTTPPIKTSIIPRGINALGFTQREPSDKKIYTQSEIIGDICVFFGGRACEELIFNNVSTGAADDWKQIDNLMEMLINHCRFEELGYTINKDNENNKFIGNILKKLYYKTYKILESNKNIIHELAKYLEEHEIIYSDDINKIINTDLRKSIKSELILIL
jgi:ATP-dependent Zn protease